MPLVLIQNKPIKSALIILFIVLSDTVYGQDTSTKPIFEYGFSISPETNYLMTHLREKQSETAFGISSSSFIHPDIETDSGFGIKQNIFFYPKSKTKATLNENQLPTSGVLKLEQSLVSMIPGLIGHYQWIDNTEQIAYNESGNKKTQFNSTFNPLFNFSTTIGFRYTQPISQKIGLIVESKFTSYFREHIVPLTNLCGRGLKLGNKIIWRKANFK